MVSMKRTAFGPVQLKGLRRGQWRELTISEVQKLKSSCKMASQTAASVSSKVLDTKDKDKGTTGAGRPSGPLKFMAQRRKSTQIASKKPGAGYAMRTSMALQRDGAGSGIRSSSSSSSGSSSG